MSAVAIRNEEDRRKAVSLLQKRKLPCTIRITAGVDSQRSIEQNQLQRKWISEAAEQLGDEPEAVRAYLKLRVGVPILREASDEFRSQYDRIVKPLQYEQKLDIMREPIDFPVTRLMTKKQKTEFLDACFQHLSEQGIFLTDPATGQKMRAA